MNLDLLIQQLGSEQPATIPPVEQWQPPLSGTMDMEIRKDGSWWHEGEPIQRPALVRLFASILRQEDGEYYLLTPVEKWRIRVADRPLLVTLVQSLEEGVQLVTATGDVLMLGAEHPLKMSELDGVRVPEVRVRQQLWARFSRNAWYELLALAEETPQQQYCVRSQGETYILD